jgi:uncharacterized membrane protein
MSPNTAPSEPSPGGSAPLTPRPPLAPPPLWPALLLVAFVAAYAVLSNGLMVHAANAPYTVALLFGPLLLAVAGVGWRRRQWLTLAGCVLLLGVLAVVVARGGVRDAQRLYVLQHAAVHAVLAWGFALTLRGGATPLITAVAHGVHTRLGQGFTPEMAHYTRALTRAWALYFVGMIAVSLLLYALAPWAWWSFFCTVLTPLAAVAAFVAEHFWRYHRHPEFPRVGMRAAFEAYQRHQQGPGAAP